MKNSRRRNQDSNTSTFTSSIIALVYLSSQSIADPISKEEWEQDDGEYGEDEEVEGSVEEVFASSSHRRQHSTTSPPSFPYLAYAISHPTQDGSIETLRRHGLPIPKWAISKKSSSLPSSSDPSSSLPQSQFSPQQHILIPRKLIISNSDTVLIPGTETPLSPILLIAVPLALSLLFLIYALICLYTSRGPLFSSATSRKVMDERARAKTELRLRGAGGYRPPGGISPEGSSLGHNQRSVGSSRMAYDGKNLGLGLTGGNDGETSSAGSSSSGLAGGGSSRPSKIPNGPRPNGGASRHGQQPSAASLLVIPTLNNSNANYRNQPVGGGRSAGTGHYAGRTAINNPPSSYSGGAPMKQTASGASGASRHRMSTSVGRGTDLGRNRSLKRETSRTSNDQIPIGNGGRRSQDPNRYVGNDPLSSNSSHKQRHPIPLPINNNQGRQPPYPSNQRPPAGPRRPTGTNPSSFAQQTQKLYGQTSMPNPHSQQPPMNNRNSTLSIGDNPLDIGEDSLEETRSRVSSAHSSSMTGYPLLPLNGNGNGNGYGYGDERNYEVPGGFYRV